MTDQEKLKKIKYIIDDIFHDAPNQGAIEEVVECWPIEIAEDLLNIKEILER